MSMENYKLFEKYLSPDEMNEDCMVLRKRDVASTIEITRKYYKIMQDMGDPYPFVYDTHVLTNDIHIISHALNVSIIITIGPGDRATIGYRRDR